MADSAWAYNACGAKKVQNARIEGSHLVVHSFHANEIVNVSEIWAHDSFSTAKVQAWAPKNPVTVYYPTGQTRDEAFWTTVFADMDLSTKSRGHTADWSLLNADDHNVNS